MKYIITTALIFAVTLSCISKKTVRDSSCDGYTFYYNYSINEVLKQIKDIPNMREISEQELNSYLDRENNFEEIEKDQIVFIPEFEFFQNPSRKGDIPLYVLGFVKNKNRKHYLAFKLHTGQNSALYIINEVNGKVTSTFLARQNYSTGFGGEMTETKKISDSVFDIKTFMIYDNSDSKGNFSETCRHQLKLSDDGYLSLIQ